MTQPPKNILTTQQLSIGYRDKKSETLIAQGMDLSFEKGQLIGLIGINGSGKSTLLRTLAGLQAPLSGKIMLRDQEDLHHIDSRLLATTLSVVLTNQPVSKNLTVSQLVALGRQPYTNWLGTLTTSDISILTQAMEATETLNLKDKKCYELSDGQLQRVLIARALSQDTNIILMDEPTTHLDLHHKASVLNVLTKIVKEQGKTVLFSTHDIEYGLHRCDKIIVVQDGKVIFDTPDRLIKENVIKNLFPSNIVIFDSVNKRFVLGE